MAKDNILKIVIPTYNRSKTTISLLESIKDVATHEFINIIVIDDNSETFHKIELKKYAENNSYINFLFLKQNSGGAGARNIGAFSSYSKWVWFIDDDDLISSDTILSAYNLLLKNTNHNLYLLSAYNRSQYNSWLINPQLRNLYEYYSRYGNDISTSCAIFNYDFFKSLGGWDSDLVAGQDSDLLLRASEKTDAYGMKNLRVTIIIHDGERITTNPKKQMIGKIQFIKKNHQRLHKIRLLRYIATTLTFYPYIRKVLNK